MVIRTHRSTKSAPGMPKEEVKTPVEQTPPKEEVNKKVEKTPSTRGQRQRIKHADEALAIDEEKVEE